MWRKEWPAIVEHTRHVPVVLQSIKSLPEIKREIPLLCVGITFKPTNESLKKQAYLNTAKMYQQLKGVTAFLVITGFETAEQLSIWDETGYKKETILNNTLTNIHGTPYLRSILDQVERACPATVPFVAYVNADIMFDNGLVRTLENLRSWVHAKKLGIMVVGRRSNHNLQDVLTVNEIEKVESELEIEVAQDYFIMTRTLIDWDKIPNFVIGRRAYDNALVDWVYHNSILVDATETVLALHQTTADGNRAGHSNANPDKEFNVELPAVSFDHGSTNHAHFKTVFLERFKRVDVMKLEDGVNPVKVWPENEVSQLSHKLGEIDERGIGATSGMLFTMNKQRIFTENNEKINRESGFSVDAYPSGLKWVVITSIFLPTKLIKTAIQMEGWCTVVVADTKSPSETDYFNHLDLASPPRCFVYLSIEKQMGLEYSIIKHLQLDSFGRKNIGYIFAVHHGAKVVYDTDDDNEVSDLDLLQFWASLTPAAGGNLNPNPHWHWTGANPYSAHGGVKGIWPRGLPLDQVKSMSASQYSWVQPHDSLQNHKKCIIQSLADQEPDVDAIYRLTNSNYPAFFSPETRYSASVVGEGQLAPFNAQATLFFEDAFDSMLLPVTVHGRVSDIWRGYMAQAILKGSCSLVFTAPWVTQVRNEHNYLADFDAEIPLYQQSSAFVKHLENSVYTSITTAMIDAYEHKLVEENDVTLAMAWQTDMDRARISANNSLIRDDKSNPTVQTQVMYRHLLILMGRGVHLKNWMTKVLENPSLSHVDMVIGIFDHSVQSLECPLTSDRVSCVSVAGTTWTSGRNTLAKEAYVREQSLSRRYTFWTLGDADINMVCVGDGDCLGKYDRFLAGLPDQVWAATLLMMGQYAITPDKIMVELQAFDAAWNTMRREAVPILLPYRTDQDSNSWWSSQAIFWNKLQCLSPNFVVAPLFIFIDNPDHNEYPRNPRNIPEEQRISDQMMGRLSGYLPRAPSQYEGQIIPDRIRSMPWTLDHTSSFGETFHQCTAEFAGVFYSFVA